jgi:hypothetical protein
MATKYKSVYQVIDTMCKEVNCTVVLVEHEGDFSGTSMYLVKNPNGLFGIVWYHYGSCAYCDAFQSYEEEEYNKDDPSIWGPFEEGFRIELKTQEWKSKEDFRAEYHMLFSSNEEFFKNKCEEYFNGT